MFTSYRCIRLAFAFPVDCLSVLLLDKPMWLPDKHRLAFIWAPAEAGAQRLGHSLTEVKEKMISP